MFIPVGYANCIMLFSISGDSELMQCGLGVDLSDAGGDMAAVGTKVGEGLMDIVEASMSSSCTLVSVDVVQGQDGGDPITTNVPVNHAGTDGDFPLPPNTALLVKKSTATGGRAGRGRFFFPGFASFGSLSAAGVLGDVYRDALQDQFDDWFDFLNSTVVGISTPPVLLHATDTPAPSPILSFTVDGKVATQRRRLRP